MTATSHSNPSYRNPACLTVLDQARAYVRAKLDGNFLPSYAALGQSVAYQTVRSDIVLALALEDVQATKAACRAWCRLVITWTRTHATTPEQRAASLDKATTGKRRPYATPEVRA